MARGQVKFSIKVPPSLYKRLDTKSKTKQIELAMTKFGKEALRLVRARTPIKTGLLINSYNARFSGDGMSWVITNTAKNKKGTYYVSFVEYGSPTTVARHMMEKTTKEIRPRLREEVKRILLS